MPEEVQRERIEKICAGDEWILDTAYGAWVDLPLARAGLVVALDYPRRLSLGRLLRRTVVRLVDRSSICNGNRESLRTPFARDSPIRTARGSDCSSRLARWISGSLSRSATRG